MGRPLSVLLDYLLVTAAAATAAALFAAATRSLAEGEAGGAVRQDAGIAASARDNDPAAATIEAAIHTIADTAVKSSKVER